TALAVAGGLRATSPLFTVPATVVAAAQLSLAGAGLTTVKAMGVTVALSVAVDALVIRPVPAPAVMSLAGAANWWRPTLRSGSRSRARSVPRPRGPGQRHIRRPRDRAGMHRR